MSPGAVSNRSEPPPAPAARRAKAPQPWKQAPIQVRSTDYYLEMVKAGRGGSPEKRAPREAPEGPASAWGGGYGDQYAEQLRRRAGDVEEAQRLAEEDRQERGYALLRRVEQRSAKHLPSSRGGSTDSAPRRGVQGK